MRERRWRGAGVAFVSLAVVLGACGKKAEPVAQAAPAGPAPGSTEWKMQDAMSAAPRAIASGATLMDWGATPTTQPTQLRAGTNGWTCFADNPATPGDDPMCMDGNFAAWGQAWMAHKPPHITGFGIAYMLKGGTDASNTDPFKMKPDSGQGWVDTGPHVMIVVPNMQGLRGVSTDPKNGGPYVMWGNTPYAHVMVPVAARGSSGAMASMAGMH